MVTQCRREKYGYEKTFNIGFSTFRGSVTASKAWDKPAQFDRVRNGLFNSFEHVFHLAAQTSGTPDYTLLFRSNNPQVHIDGEMVEELSKPRLERYIGVIYRPDTERGENTSSTIFNIFSESLL